MKIDVRIVASAAITPAENEQLWALYSATYAVDRDYFEYGKKVFTDYALFVHAGRIVGFTGVSVTETTTSEGPVLAMGLGQSVIAPAYRNQALMQRAAVRLAAKYAWSHPRARRYIWTNAISYKAYLIFAKGLREYHPSPHRPAPR